MNLMRSHNATPADEPFLFSLFAADKAAEFSPLGWSSEQLQSLLEMQFRARQQAWALTYPAAVDSILRLQDGSAIGRSLVDRQANCYRLVDLAILPAYRNRGIGAWALSSAQKLAASESVPLRLRVARANPAVRLYQRLGFRKASEEELAFEMEWEIARSQAC
jgi:ribosomal protein S18 acetylase RimI-like enzyme